MVKPELPRLRLGRESLIKKQARAKNAVKLLKKYYPDSKCSLFFNSPFQLLIATMLSAQCTDDRVNKVTPALFAKYPDVNSMAKASIKDLEKLIHSTGFYKNKAKNIKQCCKQILENFNGETPKSIDELHSLAGVGRKTANVVLGTAFSIPGMVVDTHVTRLSNRMGFVKGNNAVILERQLMPIVQKKDWVKYTHLLIDHGREICTARKPKCSRCFLIDLCPRKEVTNWA